MSTTVHLKRASFLCPQLSAVAELLPLRTEDILFSQRLSTLPDALVTAPGYKSARTVSF